jgi:2-polyprenyl-3-methyl-5-hydroxy-6-metoxy-1,4-benzoquinol methylase
MKKNCSVCNKKLPRMFIDLGDQPLCDDLVKIKNKKKSKTYRIKVSLCNKCLTVNQLYNVKSQTLFPKSYHYRAGLTKDVLRSMDNLVNTVKKYFNNKQNMTVLDIGCNDGSLLNYFYEKKFNTIGIEPTGAALECKKVHKIFKS